MGEEKKEASPKKAAKAKLEEAKTELKTFMKENKLKEDSEPTDKKVIKGWKAAKAAVTEARAALKALKGESGRRTTYEYPKDMTDAKERKKFRAAQRAAKKKGEKAATKAEKTEKKAEKSDKKKKSDD